MLATHQRRVLQMASSSFAVRVDVIDGEVVPGQLATATGATSIGGGIPDDAALL